VDSISHWLGLLSIGCELDSKGDASQATRKPPRITHSVDPAPQRPGALPRCPAALVIVSMLTIRIPYSV
jgi:hypothetical protein